MNIEIAALKIRKIELTEVPMLVDYRLKYLAELQGEQAIKNIDSIRAGLEYYFRKAITESGFLAFVAEFDGVVVGFGGMVVKEIPGDFSSATYREGDILNMYTIPEARRKGISQFILNALLKEAATLGISKVALHTSIDGENLYRKNGFTEPVYPYLELVIKPGNFTH
jgi:GNAT superfamily N-acetyltransferase